MLNFHHMNVDFIYNHPKYKQRRKDLRVNQTNTEEILWKFIKNKQIKGKKFRRQHSVDNFILDFYCSENRLGVEVDGKVHDSQKEYDVERTRILENLNIKILRFTNEEILNNIENVLKVLEQNL
jgi:very-short-patch-repair endonuclease